MHRKGTAIPSSLRRTNIQTTRPSGEAEEGPLIGFVGGSISDKVYCCCWIRHLLEPPQLIGTGLDRASHMDPTDKL